MRYIFRPLLSTLFYTLLVCGSLASAQPTVVTSVHPLYALTQDIAGEHAEVIRLLPPGASPHTFDPSPRDVAQLESADLLVMNGVLDEWLVEMAEAVNSDAPLFELVAALEFEPIEGGHDHGDDEHEDEEEHEGHGDEEHEDEGHGKDHAHDHGGVNPHLWLAPDLMAQAAPLIAGQLAELDPDNANAYLVNGERVAAELTALDDELRSMLEPVAGAAFVPFHDAWPYFARAYGLDLVVEIEPAPGREPSPAYIAEALELIEGSSALAIFSETQLPPRPAEVVAESAELPLYILDPLGGEEGRESYFDLLRHNAGIILEALGQE